MKRPWWPLGAYTMTSRNFFAGALASTYRCSTAIVNRTLAVLVTGIAVLSWDCRSPSLAITYNYVGANYTQFDIVDPNLGLFMTASATFNFAGPPPDGVYTPTSFSLQSGLFSLNSSGEVGPFVGFAGGVPVTWVLSLQGQSNGLDTFLSIISPDFFSPQPYTDQAGYIFGYEFHATDGGTWSIAADATPLPAALPLFATGLGALGLLGWRRKRKQAA